MPYPAQINPERIVEKAREMIEAEGVDHLSLNQLATALGVKAPSLYRHFGSKNELLQAVNLQTSQRLVEAVQRAVGEFQDDPRKQAAAMAVAYRDFARANPMTYLLAFSSTSPELRPDPTLLEQLALPLQAVMTAISGEGDSLAALRGVWALAHGFSLLELNGQFRRGGDLDATFMRTVEAYINGW